VEHVDESGEEEEFQYKHLSGADARLERIRYLIWKGFFAAALYNFGFGSRILLNGVKHLDDSKSKQEINRLYLEYKKIVPILMKHVDTKNRLRLSLFNMDLRTYGKVRSLFRKAE
jgi:hypothetical protein